MYDSVTAADIPADAQMVAGYVDGRYRWSDADWARFPSAVKVRIAVFASSNDGHVLDVEPGASSPGQAPGWVQMRRQAGVDPSVYVNRSTWGEVGRAFGQSGISPPHYWIAQWNGQASLIEGAVAHQYANPDLSGGHFDLSAVADFWPGVDMAQPPPPGPPPPPHLEVERVIMLSPPAGFGVLVSGSLVVEIPADETTANLQAAGVPVAKVSQAFFDSVKAASVALQGAISGNLSVSGNLAVK